MIVIVLAAWTLITLVGALFGDIETTAISVALWLAVVAAFGLISLLSRSEL